MGRWPAEGDGREAPALCRPSAQEGQGQEAHHGGICSMSLIFYRDCDNCGASEERVFVDSWTGKELCIMCLAPVINGITMSPSSDRGKLVAQLQEEGGGGGGRGELTDF